MVGTARGGFNPLETGVAGLLLWRIRSSEVVQAGGPVWNRVRANRSFFAEQEQAGNLCHFS